MDAFHIMAWMYAIVHRFVAFRNLLVLVSKAIMITIRCFGRMESERCGAFRINQSSVWCSSVCQSIGPLCFCTAGIPQILKGIRDGALILQKYAGHNLFVLLTHSCYIQKDTQVRLRYLCTPNYRWRYNDKHYMWLWVTIYGNAFVDWFIV